MIDLRVHILVGDGVWWGQGGAEPEPLVNALLDQAAQIGPIRAFCGLTWNERLSTQLPGALTVLSYGGLGELRDSAGSACSTWCPATTLRCHECSPGPAPRDVGLVQVSPPDADGLVSLGIGVEYAADALRCTRVLIAEVNQRMPATAGAPRLPLDAFAATRHRPPAARGPGPRARRRGTSHRELGR